MRSKLLKYSCNDSSTDISNIKKIIYPVQASGTDFRLKIRLTILHHPHSTL